MRYLFWGSDKAEVTVPPMLRSHTSKAAQETDADAEIVLIICEGLT